MSQVQGAAAARDVDRLLRATHRLKGALSLFGCVAAIGALNRLDRAASEGSWAQADKELGELMQEVTLVQRQFRASPGETDR
jgi:HPt (histidine-containing phosphotransfer) domain-containing protein